MAWEVIEPYYSKNLKSLTDKFEVATANNLGSNNINEIAEAAEAGRVEILLLEADRVIAKRLRNKNTGAFKQTDSTQPILDDQLDDIGELVTGTGGQVMMIPAEMMSTKTGVAAVFRY